MPCVPQGAGDVKPDQPQQGEAERLVQGEKLIGAVRVGVDEVGQGPEAEVGDVIALRAARGPANERLREQARVEPGLHGAGEPAFPGRAGVRRQRVGGAPGEAEHRQAEHRQTHGAMRRDEPPGRGARPERVERPGEPEGCSE